MRRVVCWKVVVWVLPFALTSWESALVLHAGHGTSKQSRGEGREGRTHHQIAHTIVYLVKQDKPAYGKAACCKGSPSPIPNRPSLPHPCARPSNH
jgi:hypothetical protein